MKTALLIMAAGIGSRFGGGIKQLEPVGVNDEIIIDYSIHDAIAAGFNKVIFVIRRDIREDFQARVGERVERLCGDLGVEVCYAYQDLRQIPEGCVFPEGRTKPWGTGQAVLAAKELIHEPFAVINADDYYGKEAFRKIHQYLCEPHDACCVAGFALKNTLSDNGGVTRGICKVQNGMLTDVMETPNIIKTHDGAEADGTPVDPDSIVSMNMWGFPGKAGEKPAYLASLQAGFFDFFRESVPKDPLEAEYLLPIHIGGLLKKKQIAVKVLKTDDQWFGVTYREDKEQVIRNFHELIQRGVYAPDLYSDLSAAVGV